MTNKLRPILIVLLWTICFCANSQEREKYLRFGIGVDYVLLNDQTIGEIPVDGIDASLSVGFENWGKKNRWSVSLWGAFGFMDTYRSATLGDPDIILPVEPLYANALRFPTYKTRIADRFSGRLEGQYLHSVNRPESRLKIFLGGQASLHAYYNRVLLFTNSETNYFFHFGLAPKILLEYPFRMFRKDYRLTGFFAYDILAVVARPSFSMPFPNDRMDNVRIASLNDYGLAQTHIGLFHRMRTGNAWEVAYNWQYDFDTPLNTVKQAVHSLSFTFYMNL